jgi:hypothetical protein
MKTRRLLCFALLFLGILGGCSKKVEPPRDVPLIQFNDELPTIDKQETQRTAATVPVTTATDDVGELLAKWWKEGVAAGNVGDYYDNRDDAHSDLKISLYPQLGRIVYSPDDKKAQEHYALKLSVQPQVTFGNSSTAARVTEGGSNPHTVYCWPDGIEILARQCKGNNICIYPECGDHDSVLPRMLN